MDDNVKIQFLQDAFVDLKDKNKTKETEIKFITKEVNAQSFISGNKTGMVIWFDRDGFNQAVLKLKGK